ncbi:FeoB small GTPase domain-containing protein [Natronoarchaeum sp. GCM10025703]|uniref:FeoB small GTPase domain-containing protein n=1 Tax=Natronoarchaeum sp. GCM10025703 TaxID=3252685 RepID=UPI00361C5075
MSGCHDDGTDPTDLPGEDADTVALVGAPNVGKSAVFNRLADREVDVSNYPGTTAAATVAEFDGKQLADAPGTYGISSFSEEERIAREVVLDADAVINVVDATQLDRDLFLTYQLLDMGIPTVVSLNVMDEMRRDGDEIDVDALRRNSAFRSCRRSLSTARGWTTYATQSTGPAPPTRRRSSSGTTSYRMSRPPARNPYSCSRATNRRSTGRWSPRSSPTAAPRRSNSHRCGTRSTNTGAGGSTRLSRRCIRPAIRIEEWPTGSTTCCWTREPERRSHCSASD